MQPNYELMEQRGLSKAEREVLDNVYNALSGVLVRPELRDDPVQEIEAMEYTMQLLWGFPLDKKYHTYWNKIKGCTCPELDNRDLEGTGIRVYNQKCPWHGGEK